MLGQRTGAGVRDQQEHHEEDPSHSRGGVNRGPRPVGLPVVSSRWRCRTTDAVRGRSFLLRFAPVRGGSWGGAWEPAAQSLDGSKKIIPHVTGEKFATWKAYGSEKDWDKVQSLGPRIGKRGQDAQKVDSSSSLRFVPVNLLHRLPLWTPFTTSEVRMLWTYAQWAQAGGLLAPRIQIEPASL